MSHSVTVTRTCTTTTTSAILLNIGYFKTVPGILKLAHVILGIVAVALVAYFIPPYYYSGTTRVWLLHKLFTAELFFLLIATWCLITSTLLLFACLISIATATILPKTCFEIIYHGTAFVLLLIASLVYLIEIQGDYKDRNNAGTQFTCRTVASEFILLSSFTLFLTISAFHYIISIIDRNYNFSHKEPGYFAKIFAGIIGLINAILYGIAAVFAYRYFKSG